MSLFCFGHKSKKLPSLTGSFRKFRVTSELDVRANGCEVRRINNVEQAIKDPLEEISVHCAEHNKIMYVSKKNKRSESCALVRQSDLDRAVISTIYPSDSKVPTKMYILSGDTKVTVEDALANKDVQGDEVEPKHEASDRRYKQVFETARGKFGWRYGCSWECEQASGANLVLILEDVNDGTCVALFIRNTTSSKWERDKTGSGGRLLLDLRKWKKDKAAAVEEFAVASCILMLKSEVDYLSFLVKNGR